MTLRRIPAPWNSSMLENSTVVSTPARSLDGITMRRIDYVGRTTLWAVTFTLLFLLLAGLSSLLWLVAPFGRSAWFLKLHAAILWMAFLFLTSALLMLFVGHRFLVPPRDFMYSSLENARVHVGLTAWNDEEAIVLAVREFKACHEVDKVVVVDNNSRDNTARAATEAGADEVVVETRPGYGACCMRTLSEAAKDADVVILCEGHMTFSANDVKKFLAYLENCDFVLGTRATQELRASVTQMDWLLNPGNQIVAKLAQSRFWGTRLTDMGCTYRAVRAESYRRLADRLTVAGNHFAPHMFIEALKLRMRIIEIPVVFRARMGESKGVGSNKLKAARVALRMLGLIYRA
jgi:Glycosyl transferase family 2